MNQRAEKEERVTCPDCETAGLREPTRGSPPGIRRHRISAHSYPPRAEFVDRFFDENEAGSARGILNWLRLTYPDGNWPYEEWSQKTVSRDLSQHHNYPSRHQIRCVEHGSKARWIRVQSLLAPLGDEAAEPPLAEWEAIIVRIAAHLTEADRELQHLRQVIAGGHGAEAV